MHLNILHRTDPGRYYEVFRREQELAHELGFRTNLFLHYPDLFDDRVVDQARDDERLAGDELGLALHRLNGPGLEELRGGLDALWLHPEARKRAILERVLARYREVFGADPVSVAAYHLDASCLRLLRELSPGTEIVVGGCFEEGVRVYHGCNHSWYLFNEGMPWNPWYPSKTHSLRPAADAEDAVGLIAVPHLMRDMSLSYEGRNDFWASHPPNTIRGMGNEATWCPYDLNLIDQFRANAAHNGGYAYYNTFVSAPWLTWNHNSEYPPEVAVSLYRQQLTYLAQLAREGAVVNTTLREYAAWHRHHRPVGDAQVYWAREMLYGSGKHYFWYQDSAQRVLVDATQGGSIGDLRPYLGRCPVSTGPDTPHGMLGTYPYLIQSQHRTGYPHHYQDGARTTLLVRHGDETLDLCACRTRVAAVERTSAGTRLRLTPATLRFADGLTATVVTTYLFQADGQTLLERTLGEVADPTAELELTEYLKGAPGRTDYPEDLHGIRLELEADETAALDYAYTGQSRSAAPARSVTAVVPQVRTRLQLAAAEAPARCGEIREGHLFSPYFTLQLTYRLRQGESCRTWMRLQSIA